MPRLGLGLAVGNISQLLPVPAAPVVVLPDNPAGPVVFVSNKTAQSLGPTDWFAMNTSTNRGRTYWWDGTFTDTDATGAYWQGPQKAAVGGIVSLSAFSTNSTGTVSGFINQLLPTYGQFLSVDYSGCSRMGSISIDQNLLPALSALNFTGCKSLTYLNVAYSPLRSLIMTGVSALQSLTLQSTMLSSVVVPADSVTYLALYDNPQLRTVTLRGLNGGAQMYIANSPLLCNIDLSTIRPLDVSIYINPALSAITFGSATSTANMQYLDVHGNNLSAIDIPSLDNAYSLRFDYNKLTSIIMPAGFTSRSDNVGSIDISYNQLDATALNNFFTNLGTYAGIRDVYGIGGTISYAGNPGSATCNPSIASAKGWQPY